MRETTILAAAAALVVLTALGQPAVVVAQSTAVAPAATAPATASTTEATADVAGDRYRSYAAVASEGFRGSVAGGYSVEQLMGRDVVGPDGDEIAEVADLLVETDDRIRKVIVDVGGFLGIGAKPVVLDIAQLSRRGDSQDLHTSMTREQLEALPSYERGADGYYVRGKGN